MGLDKTYENAISAMWLKLQIGPIVVEELKRKDIFVDNDLLEEYAEELDQAVSFAAEILKEIIDKFLHDRDKIYISAIRK